MRKALTITASCLILAAMPAGAQIPTAANNATTIELTAEASRNAANDLGRAVLYVEGSDASLPALSRKLNAQIASALALAKTYSNVNTRTGAVQSWPGSARSSVKIEGWRMRSEIVLESRETAPLSELIGKLQASGLALATIGFQPAPDTRKKVENETIVDAIAAFRARADVAAGTFGRKYRVRQIAISTQGAPQRPPYYPMAKMAMASDAAPAPVEAGESEISVTVSGYIELQ